MVNKSSFGTDFPSMKKAKNMDGSMKINFPSMKKAENVDGTNRLWIF